mmetsp:Transcript_19981/g.48942  ORF Transcript_19981/g.48942 Transcript_19981/m.48942 type:complete len:191 (-) Transcript_19981:504-1076(-)
MAEAGEEANPATKPGALQLCPHCKNLLYPVSGPDQKLYFKCKKCKHSKIRSSGGEENKVFENDLVVGSSDVDAIMHKNLTLDPGLPRRRDVICPKCKQEGRKSNNVKYFCPIKETMAIYFICCNCYNYWKQTAHKSQDEAAQTPQEEEAKQPPQEEEASQPPPKEEEEEVDDHELFGESSDEDKEEESNK